MKNSKIFKIIIIIAISLIPFIYSFFYLKAFWDPYGNLGDMKIAIVNEDEGNNNENIGQELVDKLKEKNVVTIDVVSNEEAKDGLVNQKYYATLTIPKDFTQTINSAETENKVTTTLTYSPNQKTNYLASQIISKVVTGVEKDLRSEISKEVVTNLSDNLKEVPDNLNIISDNLGKLSEGAQELTQGTQDFSDGTNKLATNYSNFNNGISDLLDGMTTFNGGMKVFNSNIEKLNKGVADINANSKNLSKLTKGASEIATNSNAINSAISQYIDANNNSIDSINNALDIIINNPNSDAQSIAVASGIKKQISDSNAKALGTALKQKENELNSGIQTFSKSTTSLDDLSSALDTLASSTNSLDEASDKLENGSSNLVIGTSKIKDASNQIKNGIDELTTASSKLNSGSNELLNGTSTFNNEVNNSISDTKTELQKLDGLDEYTANPVKIEESDYSTVNTYGTSFTPYFVSLSLWVGSLILLIVLYYDPHSRFPMLSENANNKILRFLIYAGLATFQGLILGFLLKSLLHFTVTNIWLYYVSFILIANVFFTIIHFLITEFDDVGKLLSIILLVLQLSASGGTFPIETVPAFFQKIHPFMPFTYTMGLLKESIVSEDLGFAKKYSLILLGIICTFIILTVIVEFIKKGINKSIDKKIKQKHMKN